MADLLCRRCGASHEHSESLELDMIRFDEKIRCEGVNTSGKVIPQCAPKYNFGDVLVSQRGFRGRVNMIFANYDAVLSAGIVSENWLKIQEVPPSTKDQVFYSLVGDGAILVGEKDVYSASGPR